MSGLLGFALGCVAGLIPIAVSRALRVRADFVELRSRLLDAQAECARVSDSLRFARADHAETMRILANVVAGISAPADDPSMTPAERDALRVARSRVAQQARA